MLMGPTTDFPTMEGVRKGEAPIDEQVQRSYLFNYNRWKRTQFDPQWFHFGLLWKLQDMGVGWTFDMTPQNLFDSCTTITHDRWVLGGIKGRDFLMAPVDSPGEMTRTIRTRHIMACNVSNFNECSTYLMGRLRDYLWLNSS